MRLLTLHGAGGVGKTRLALRLAAQLRPSFADGVIFTALAPVREPELVWPTVAAACGVKGERDLAEHLGRRELMLVLDNCEHVLPAMPRVADLLRAAPALRVLATSRAPLNLFGECRYRVEPLAEAAAAELFVDRARSVEGLAEEAAAIGEICRRLDCLPLALELAAARTTMLSPSKLAERLQRRLPLLERGPRDLPERQQTLRAAIDWSYALLDPEQQRVFAGLSVFVGGSTVDAAEQVLEAMAGLAAVAAACGDGDRALRLWAAVEELEDLLGAPLVENERRRYERYLLPHRKDAGPAAAHGPADSLEATIELALNEGAYLGRTASSSPARSTPRRPRRPPSSRAARSA